jgi:hypothetical protein
MLILLLLGTFFIWEELEKKLLLSLVPRIVSLFWQVSFSIFVGTSTPVISVISSSPGCYEALSQIFSFLKATTEGLLHAILCAEIIMPILFIMSYSPLLLRFMNMYICKNMCLYLYFMFIFLNHIFVLHYKFLFLCFYFDECFEQL